MDLGHLVKGDGLLSVVSDGHDETKSVAFIQEALDLVPFAVEVQHFRQGRESHVGEEVLALLKNANSESLLDVGAVLLEVRHDFDGLGKRLATELTDLEGRLLELHEFEEGGNVWVTDHIVEVLDKDGVDQACMGWHALDLQHLADF
jgi:hypothetical protein